MHLLLVLVRSLGHVFGDGPELSTWQSPPELPATDYKCRSCLPRYCVNGLALRFRPRTPAIVDSGRGGAADNGGA